MKIRISKQMLLNLAEIIDAYRVVPRAMLLAYGYVAWDILAWIQGVPVVTTQHAAILASVLGLAAPLAGFYQSTGRPWNLKHQ